MSDSDQKHIEEALTEKRDALLRERVQIRRERVQLSQRDLEIDRELADCRAAARLFHLAIEFPAESPTSFSWAKVLESLSSVGANDASKASRSRTVNGTGGYIRQSTPSTIDEKKLPALSSQQLKTERPPIRDIVLDRLRAAGTKGTTASQIQQYIENIYSSKIHYKTVGMTLYRLSKEKLVHREKRTWFFVSQNGETKNPGVGAPGSINRA